MSRSSKSLSNSANIATTARQGPISRRVTGLCTLHRVHRNGLSSPSATNKIHRRQNKWPQTSTRGSNTTSKHKQQVICFLIDSLLTTKGLGAAAIIKFYKKQGMKGEMRAWRWRQMQLFSSQLFCSHFFCSHFYCSVQYFISLYCWLLGNVSLSRQLT